MKSEDEKMRNKIYIGADSAGYTLKEELGALLRQWGYEVYDMGTDSTASCHYPEYAAAVCHGVLESNGEAYGLLVCGTGIGMSMCANKFDGIRAAVVSDTFSARMTRAHNDANVICIGARVIGSCLAEELLRAFLDTEFEGGRHAVRVDMMKEIEEGKR